MTVERVKTQGGRKAVLLAVFCLAVPCFGEDAGDAARNAFLNRFTKFSGDKNIMTNTTKIGGKKMGAGNSRLNQDDGVTFKADLTYHDFSFNAIDQNKNEDKNNKEAKVDRLYAFVSSHGGVSAAGGSSLLERTTYGLHKQLTKQDTEEGFKRDDEKLGIKFRSVFKISTQEVFNEEKGDGGGKGGKADKKGEPDKVERAELREDEVRPEIDKVGVGSFETLRRAAREEGSENDQTALPNSVLLRYAAGEATQALWNSTLSNLVQRRVNRGVRAGGLFPDTPQLSEGVPTVDQWAAAANQAVLANVKDDNTKKQLQEEMKRMVEQGKTLQGLPWNVVNARFEPDEKGKGDVLKTGDINKEDGFVRDMRVQLEIMAKAGKTADQVPSNWKYDAKDNKAKVSINFDESGQPLGEQDMTVAEQLNSYNKQLQAAAEGYNEVQQRMPGLKVDTDQILGYQIQPNSKSMMEINQVPASALDEAGLNANVSVAAQDYNELLETSKGGGKTKALASDGGVDVSVDPSSGNGTPNPPQQIGYDDNAPKR